MGYFGKLSPGDRIGAMGLPPFHAMGVVMQLYFPLAFLVTAAVPPPLAIDNTRMAPMVPTSDNILDGVRRTHCNVLMTVPTFLGQWAASADAVNTLRKLDQVVSIISALIDGTPDHILCRNMVAVHFQKGSGISCGPLASTSVSHTAGRNLVAPSLRATDQRLGMGNGCGCDSRMKSR